jgi:glycosyltransferase involved in cell wall biosynthesis
MRIVYLHQYFNTRDNSGGTRSYEIARRLVQNGHEVNVITSDRRADANFRGWRQQNVDGVNIDWIAVPYANRMDFGARVRAFVHFALASAAKAARIPADVIFATSTPLTIAIPAIYAKLLQRIPMVFEVRDLWPEMPISVGALRNPVAITVARLMERTAYRSATEIIALSPGMADSIAGHVTSPNLITVIPNAADLDLFQVPPELGLSFRSEHAWLGERPLVLYAGTLGSVNAVRYLVDLAAETRRLDPAVRFLAVGDGRDKSTVVQRARDLGVLNENFFVMDPVPKRDMPALLSAATVTTSLFANIPNMWKNSANKFFDGLAAGRPVVINYGGWMADLLREHDAGCVLAATDLAAAAHSLTQALHDRAWLTAAGKAAVQLARSQFDRDLLTARLEAVLVRAVEASRTAG